MSGERTKIGGALTSRWREVRLRQRIRRGRSADRRRAKKLPSCGLERLDRRIWALQALISLSDPDHQRRVWVDDGFPGPWRFRDTFAIAVDALFDHAAVFPDVAGNVGVTLFPTEVAAMERLRDALVPIVVELGAEDAPAYLGHPRWPAVIEAASAAAGIMQANLAVRSCGVPPWKEDPVDLSWEVRLLVRRGTGVRLRVASRYGDPAELSGVGTRRIGELLLKAADELDMAEGVPVGSPSSAGLAEPATASPYGYAWIDPDGGLTMKAIDRTNCGFVTLTAPEARWLGHHLLELAAEREPVPSRLTAPYRNLAWVVRVVRYRFSGV